MPDPQPPAQPHDGRSSSPRPIRRIVTANDSDGRSHIVEDGPSPHVRTVEHRPGYRITNLWATDAMPVPVDGPDALDQVTGVLPPPGGNVLRIIDFPPEPNDPDELARGLAATFTHLLPDAHQDTERPHPGMHLTRTVDYAIVLDGEVVAILDDSETLMRAGDVLIQRATNHAWANRSGRTARIAFVLIDGA
jgi:hypothetical protein